MQIRCRFNTQFSWGFVTRTSAKLILFYFLYNISINSWLLFSNAFRIVITLSTIVIAIVVALSCSKSNWYPLWSLFEQETERAIDSLKYDSYREKKRS